MDKYLQDIVRDKRYWESKRQNIRQQEKKLEDITARYEQDLEAVNKQRKEIMRNAKEEAQRILSEPTQRSKTRSAKSRGTGGKGTDQACPQSLGRIQGFCDSSRRRGRQDRPQNGKITGTQRT